jgi:hypothetical protein
MALMSHNQLGLYEVSWMLSEIAEQMRDGQTQGAVRGHVWELETGEEYYD